MNELTDEQITSIAYDCNALPEVVTDETLAIFARAIIAADRAQQSARHREELLAYEVTVGNLRAQREQAQPVAHENCVPVACLVETDSGVMVWPIRNSAEACTYCDPDEIPQMLYLHPATPQAQPGHKPMTDGEKLYAMWHSSDANDLDDFLDGWRHAEAFHGIKEKP